MGTGIIEPQARTLEDCFCWWGQVLFSFFLSQVFNNFIILSSTAQAGGSVFPAHPPPPKICDFGRPKVASSQGTRTTSYF